MYRTNAQGRRWPVMVAIVLLSLTLMAALSACQGRGGEREQELATEVATMEVAATEAPEATEAPAEEPTAEPEPTEELAAEEEEADESALAGPLASMEHTADTMLIDITWEWVSRDPNGNDIEEITVDDPENYTLLFDDEGVFMAQVDCNNAAGEYATSSIENEQKSIFMQLGPMTRAMCREGSLDQAMIQMFGPAQSYYFEDDGETLVFLWAAAGPIDTYRKAAPADESEPEEAEAGEGEEAGEVAEGEETIEGDLDTTLANMTYTSEFTKDGMAPLVDGKYEEEAAPGSATKTTVMLLPEFAATGELNDESAAAVILATNPGGSGTFIDLAIVMEQEGEPVNVATTSLGDRAQVSSVTIDNNQVVVEMVTHGPDDPMCCPTLQVVQTYELQDGQLTLVDTQEIGTVEDGESDEADEDEDAEGEEAAEGDLDTTLANMTYTSEFTKDGTAPLVDGKYEEEAAPGSASKTTVMLLPELTATGELNDESAAAVILATDPGGSGTFIDLAIVIEQEGEPVNVATTSLGDRAQVSSVTIENNQVVVQMITHSPDDPMCCPTLQVVQTYELQNGQLALVDTQEIGTVEEGESAETGEGEEASEDAAEDGDAAEEAPVDPADPDPVAEDTEAPEVELPDAEASEPTGVVIAEAGVNVRTGPGTAYAIVGVAPLGAEGEIVGKSEDGQWWVAIAPSAPDEHGWVSAAYVETTNADDVPVIPAPPVPEADAALPVEDAALAGGDGYEVQAGVLVYSASRVLKEGNRSYDLEDIYVVAAAPGSTTELVANNAMQPAVSPDRQTLSFKSMQSDKFGLGGYDLNTADRLRFSRFNEDSNPRWSPGGDRMVYASNKEGDRAWRVYITEAVAKENPEDMTYTELGFGLDPDWHPTYEQIVFKGCNDQGQECGLYTLGTDGSGRTLFTNEASDSRPRWFPDGSAVVFMSEGRDGNWELYRANADGSDVARLTDNAAPDGLPAVSPDGSQIAFYSKRGDSWGVWIMPAEGGEASLVTAIEGEQPDWLVQGIDWPR